MSNDDSSFNILLSKIKKIIEEKEPNKIKMIFCNFGDNEYNYNNLINYINTMDLKDKDSDDELFDEYKKIRDFDNNSVGIFSLFYFKGLTNFLAIVKSNKQLYFFNIKCSQYQNVLNRALTSKNQIYVLTYWIF